MTTMLRSRAVAIVNEMIALGAVFDIEPTAAGSTFVWRGRPADTRDAIAAYWNSIDKPHGLREAMTAYIVQVQKDRVGGIAL